jgi:hypothetical protein
MNRQLRSALLERRRALQRDLKGAKIRLRARVRAHPIVRARAQRRRRRRLILLAALVALLALLFQRCSCGSPLPPPTPAQRDGGHLDAGSKVRATVLPSLKGPRITHQPRAQLDLEGAEVPAWLEDFRLQVAARSPKLARCFDGADRPGALRWTVAMSLVNGGVSDHELEPIGGSDLGQGQRDCLLQALSVPRYRITHAPDGGDATPRRISIVVEF